jgi:hypothetical protein
MNPALHPSYRSARYGTFALADGDGNEITAGLDETAAFERAAEWAAERDETVEVYDSTSPDCSWTVEPDGSIEPN